MLNAFLCRWECGGEEDCRELAALQTLNRTAVSHLARLTCRDSDQNTRSLQGFLASCSDITDVLPVSAPRTGSPLLVILISVSVVVLLLVLTSAALLTARHSLYR